MNISGMKQFYFVTMWFKLLLKHLGPLRTSKGSDVALQETVDLFTSTKHVVCVGAE